ncbi:hypothetical protein [Streptomyces sp. NPDC059881]|uniref:LexA family protein n=1 Tax=Streptomyces sp. NPDC059881 TaxID=3346986 RepID=UPI0036480DDF
MTDELTDRQARILRFTDHIVDTGQGPSIRRIGVLDGLSSSSSVAYQLGRLEERGLISRSGPRWRDCHMT